MVPIDHLDHMAHGSELYTGYALDGLGQAPNDDEIASVPDLDHVIQLPWQPEVAWMPADNTFHGEPYPLSTRVALKNIQPQAAAMGFGFNLGIEAELYVLRQNEDGTLAVPTPEDKLKKPCYDARGFLGQFNWIDRMATTMHDLGSGLYSFDHEDANGQFEFDFSYADGLITCDRYTFLRLMPKEYARQEGLLATFMPKPFAHKTGNGAHFNMSLYDLETGRNLFACAPADGAVNPYLAATLALAAGLEGIRDRIDPGKPQEDNVYALTEAERIARGIEFLPRSLAEAVDAFAADPFITETLGQELRDEFIRYKRDEWNEYHQSISAWEIERYSHLF